MSQKTVNMQLVLSSAVTLRDAMHQARLNSVALNKATGVSRQVIADCAETFQPHNQLKTIRRLVDGLPGFGLIVAIVPLHGEGSDSESV